MHVRNSNLTKVIDYKIQKYIDDGFGYTQLYFEILGIHPSYQSLGAGTQLVQSGINFAAEEHLDVTFTAQPSAEIFYLGNHIGFDYQCFFRR
jgi:GNAT superfamily N-acetyltransferase